MFHRFTNSHLLHRLYFKIQEYCITGEKITQKVADAIMNDHIVQMSLIRYKYDAPIDVSQHSGFRPVTYEKSRGRSGTSEHTFSVKHPDGRGAADYTCGNLKKLLRLLFKYSNYQRIAYYPHHGFIHCDFKPSPHTPGRLYFEADKKGTWVFKNKI